MIATLKPEMGEALQSLKFDPLDGVLRRLSKRTVCIQQLCIFDFRNVWNFDCCMCRNASLVPRPFRVCMEERSGDYGQDVVTQWNVISDHDILLLVVSGDRELPPLCR